MAQLEFRYHGLYFALQQPVDNIVEEENLKPLLLPQKVGGVATRLRKSCVLVYAEKLDHVEEMVLL